MEPLPHVDRLVDETRGARFFTKLDLAMAYMQFRIREEDQYKTSFRVPGGQYEFRVGAFGLHGMSSVLTRSFTRARSELGGTRSITSDLSTVIVPAPSRKGLPYAVCWNGRRCP